MIDLHIHLLPGIDDGPPDVPGTVALARACVDDGIQAVAATPHVSQKYQTTPAQMGQAVEAARAAINDAGVPLTVYGGAEIAIDRMAQLSDEDLKAFTLGPSDGFILLETPYAAWPMDLENQLGRLAVLGIRGILAHPERSAGVQAAGGIDKLAFAVSRGLYAQLTAGSISGRFGRTAQSTAQALLERELVHVISSDAHNTDRRPPRLGEAAAQLGNPDLAKFLTMDAPLAIVKGERLPPRPIGPAPKKRRRLFGRN